MKTRLTFVLLLLLTSSCFAHSVMQEGDRYVIAHEWKHNNIQWNCSISVPIDLYQYYQGRAHLSDDMVQFVLSDYDRICVRNLVKSFRDGGDKADYSDADNMRNVISFVQSLRYVSDMDSKGQDEYVRFPVETLVDGVGDCEDLSILAAAILYEMGYEVLLVILPDHLALAVNCGEDFNGTYYFYEGSKYYYLEVTNQGWDIGQIPREFRDCQAKLVPLVYQPRLRLMRCSYQHDAYYSNDREVPFVLQCELENAGPGTTENLSVHVLFSTSNGVPVVDQVFSIDELTEGVSVTCEIRVNVPRPLRGAMEVRAEGTNFGTETMQFKDVNLK